MDSKSQQVSIIKLIRQILPQIGTSVEQNKIWEPLTVIFFVYK
jgi:hypothetical protein